MASAPITVHIPVTAEILIRFQGSEELHLLGTVQQEFPIEFRPAGPDSHTMFQFAPGVMNP